MKIFNVAFMPCPIGGVKKLISDFRLHGCILSKIKVILVVPVSGLVGIDTKIMKLSAFNFYMFCLFSAHVEVFGSIDLMVGYFH